MRMYLRWSLCTRYLHTCQVRVTVGNSGLCCCTCVTSFEHQWTPLCVGSVESLKTSSLIRPLPILTGNRNADLMSPVLIVAVLHKEVLNQWLGQQWRHISVFAWVERESERQREREWDRDRETQRETEKERHRESERARKRERVRQRQRQRNREERERLAFWEIPAQLQVWVINTRVSWQFFRSSASPACSTVFPCRQAVFSPWTLEKHAALTRRWQNSNASQHFLQP